jgi:SAM-dependent methyltransferase
VTQLKSNSYEVLFDDYYAHKWKHDSTYSAYQLLLNIAYPYSVEINLKPGAKWLELGVGTGRVIDYHKQQLKHSWVIGLDWSLHGVREMNETLDIEANGMVGDVKKLPFPKGSFDLITLFGTLQAYEKELWGKGLKDLYSFLSPGGKIGFSLHPRSSLELIRSLFAWRLFPKLMKNTVTEKYLENLLLENGFKHFSIERHKAFTVLMRLSRLFGVKLISWFGFIEYEDTSRNRRLVKLFDQFFPWLTFGHYWIWIKKND